MEKRNVCAIGLQSHIHYRSLHVHYAVCNGLCKADRGIRGVSCLILCARARVRVSRSWLLRRAVQNVLTQ